MQYAQPDIFPQEGFIHIDMTTSPGASVRVIVNTSLHLFQYEFCIWIRFIYNFISSKFDKSTQVK